MEQQNQVTVSLSTKATTDDSRASGVITTYFTKCVLRLGRLTCPLLYRFLRFVLRGREAQQKPAAHETVARPLTTAKLVHTPVSTLQKNQPNWTAST